MTNLNLNQIADAVAEVYPENLIPEGAVAELVERIYDADNRKVAKNARSEFDKGDYKDGLIIAVKKAIQEHNKADVAVVDNRDARTRQAERSEAYLKQNWIRK